jgi:hypothetical protein
MADSNEPKEDTIRIDLPPQPGSKLPGPDTKSRETVRIQLGLRQPSDSPQPRKLSGVADTLPLHAPTEPIRVSKPAAQVLTSPEVFPPSSATPQASTEPASASQASASVDTLPGAPSSSPKKETARIPRMPDPLAKPVPNVQMKKTQPLIAMPHTAPKKASIAVAPAEKSIRPLCWVLLGVAATILIIQIWTYFS